MNISAYQARQYGRQPCWELVADVYARERFPIVVSYAQRHRTEREMADAFRIGLHGCDHGFVRTDRPANFDIVLMGRNRRLGIHHCGIWYEGRILHAEPGATLYEEATSVRAKYPIMEFWTHVDPGI